METQFSLDKPPVWADNGQHIPTTDKGESAMKPIPRFALGLIAAALAVAALVILVIAARTKGDQKSITVQVVHGDGSAVTCSYETAADTLGEVLLHEGLVQGSTDSGALFVTTVDGETADLATGSHWALLRNGELTNCGLDQARLSDGDQFSLIYSTD